MSFRDIGESVSNAVLQRVGRASARAQEARGLSADVLESEDAYLVVFDAPGATGSDVQVRYVDGVVEVRADRFRPFHEGFEMRFPGRGLALDGEADLPEGAAVDPDGASATLTERGTLEVHLPKTDDDADDGPSGSVTLTGDADDTHDAEADDTHDA
jgi:HSP20 family molecular chaperone IbpA